jgi:hypothetical protein
MNHQLAETIAALHVAARPTLTCQHLSQMQQSVEGVPTRKRKNLSLSRCIDSNAKRQASSAAECSMPAIGSARDDMFGEENRRLGSNAQRATAAPESSMQADESARDDTIGKENRRLGSNAQRASAAPKSRTAQECEVVAPFSRSPLPPSYAPVLHVSAEVRKILRLRIASDGQALRRGTLPAGWRPLIKLKKLRRVYMKAERNVSTAPNPETKTFVKKMGLTKAAEVVPNLRCLEALLFTTFVEFEVKRAVWPVMETKTFQTSVRALEQHGNRVHRHCPHFPLSGHGLRTTARGRGLWQTPRICIVGGDAGQGWRVRRYHRRANPPQRNANVTVSASNSRDNGRLLQGSRRARVSCDRILWLPTPQASLPVGCTGHVPSCRGPQFRSSPSVHGHAGERLDSCWVLG